MKSRWEICVDTGKQYAFLNHQRFRSKTKKDSRIEGSRFFYGIVLITPLAPVGMFGVASKMSDGHAVTTILIAMIAMMLTAFSYGRMSAIYPSARSAYVYVGKGLNAHLGFFAGPKRLNPAYNLVVIGVVVLIGFLILNYERGCPP